MKRIVIIGVSHSYQVGPPACTEAEGAIFSRKLVDLLDAYGIEVLGEEFHEDFLQGKEETLCHAASNFTGADHLYLEFSKAGRQARKILTPQDVEIMSLSGQIKREESHWELCRSMNLRELHWLSQVLERNSWPVLLVIGSNHVQSFAKKAETCGIDVVIDCEYWKADQ